MSEEYERGRRDAAEAVVEGIMTALEEARRSDSLHLVDDEFYVTAAYEAALGGVGMNKIQVYVNGKSVLFDKAGPAYVSYKELCELSGVDTFSVVICETAGQKYQMLPGMNVPLVDGGEYSVYRYVQGETAKPLSRGSVMIAAERIRQICEEGYDSGHDDTHVKGELAYAAAAYAISAVDDVSDRAINLTVDLWPWRMMEFKSDEDPVRDLVKAGALIAAELDRRLRKREG